MSHKIYEVGDYSSSDAEEKDDSNSESDVVLSVRRGGSKNSKPVFTAANNPGTDASVPKTRRAEFLNDYSDGEKEDVVHMKHSARDHSRTVAPSVPNLEAAEVVDTQKAKPKGPEKKKNNSKGIHKGQSLTAGDAVEFMIKERQSLDEEFAAMRRENNKLKQDLKMKQEKTVVEKVVVDPNSKKQLVDLEKLRKENLELKKKKDEMEQLLKTQRAAPAAKKMAPTKEASSESSSASSESDSESSGPQKPVQSKKQIKPVKKASPRAIKSTAIATKSGSPETALPLTGKKFNSLPAVLWDGGKLWKIPYNGKGMPEERIVMIKRALRPGPQARPVRVLSKGEEARDGATSVPVAYVAYPPAIIWYNAQKPNEAKFAREIVLVEGAYLVDGHQTPAFWKMVNRGVPMPPKELCFSIVTSTRTLDLAAETLREANTWKNAIHMLLVMMTTSKDWGVQNLRRETPTWHHDSMLKETAANNNSSNHPASEESAPKQPKSGVMKEQMFTATKLNNFAALDDLLRSGVPVNLMEADTADTPLMVACRKNFPVIAKLCLDYGGKNDPHPDFGQTALHAAVAAGSYDCVDVLLDAAAPSGANATISNLPDPRGETPLHTAAMLGHGKIAELLISHGAQMHTPDAEGKNAIHLCAVGGHRGCLALLFDQGGDELIESRDSDGNTALHLAAEFGHLPVVRLLLETAANTSVRNNRGLTPYAIASAKGHHQVGILLLEYASGLSPVAKRSTNQSAGFADRGLGRRAISDTRAQLEQQRLRQSAFGEDDDDDKSGGAYSLDVIEHDNAKHPQRTQLRRQNSYPIEVSSGLPRPHTSGHACSPGINESPRASGHSLVSPLATSDRLVGHYDDHGGMMSARGFDSTRTSHASDEYMPKTSRERPTPALFEGLSVSKASHAASHHEAADRQYSGSPGQNVVNGDRDMAEYYSYVKKNEESYSEHNVPSSYAGTHSSARASDFHVYPPESLRSPSPQRNSRQPYGESYDNQYSYAAPLEEFDSLGHRWQVFQTDEGYYYYLIEGSEHSQWDDPRTHGYQDYTEASEPVVSASPVRNQMTPSRQGSIEEIGSPNDAFKHPKAVAGKKKPIERVKHVRALKRAPRKIELDVTPSAITPDTEGRPSRTLKSRSEYDDEDTYSSDHSITTDEFSSSLKDVRKSLRQQSSLDELRKSNKNGTDDSDGDIDGEVPEIRLVERKRASPVRLKSGGFSQVPEAKQSNEYFAEVSGFVRRNLAPLDLGSDDEEAEVANKADAEDIVDVDAIPTLEDNLVVVPSPEREVNHQSPPARSNKSSPDVSTPTKKNSGSVPRMSPSVEDIKSIDSYWRQSSANQDKRTPRSRAKMSLMNNGEGDLLGGNGAFETTRSVTTQKTAYSDEEDTAEVFRKTIDDAKKELPARAGRYGVQGGSNNADDEEWDEAKSANEGSDWDEDMHAATPLFTRKSKGSDVIAALTEPEQPAEAITVTESKKNVKLAPLPKPQLSEKDLLRNRQFSSDDSGYGNGGNVFESRSASTDSATESNNFIVQKYLDMLYTMSARSVRALMEKNGEADDIISEFSRVAEKIDIAATSSVVNRGNILKKLAASGSGDSKAPLSSGPYVSQSIG